LQPPGYVPPQIEIVGVVQDVKESRLSADPPPTLYVPHAQGAEGTTSMYLVVRSTAATEATVNTVRNAVKSLDREVPLANVATMEDRVREAVRQPRMNAVLLGVFAGLALLLSAVGIYGVTAYSVSQRTAEIGVRMALGATPQNILRLITGEASRLLLVGWLIGLVGAFAAGRLVTALLFGVKPHDALTLAMVSVVLATVAIAACLVPGRRAASVEPITALRRD
jgi:ABC-type antimicrobial peptide transport system permease subunit